MSAFQLAGYGQVIGTLWVIDDRRARQIADETYAAPARDAVRRRCPPRRDPPHEPSAGSDWPSEWASHVHVGA